MLLRRGLLHLSKGNVVLRIGETCILCLNELLDASHVVVLLKHQVLEELDEVGEVTKTPHHVTLVAGIDTINLEHTATNLPLKEGDHLVVNVVLAC